MTDPALPASGSVSIDVAVGPEALWPLISDPSMPAAFSHELQEAAFQGADEPGVGAVIEGRNARGDFSWTTTSRVTACDEPGLFRWVTGAEGPPGATWTLTAESAAGGARLTHEVVLHAGGNPLGPAIEAEPLRAHEIVDARLREVLANMTRTIEGIAAIAEGRAARP